MGTLLDGIPQLGGDYWVVTVSSHELLGCAVEEGALLLHDLVDVRECGLDSSGEPGCRRSALGQR
jgi:hypothetical protein